MSGSTGAQPSAEAIEAAILSTREDLERLKAWARYALVDSEAFVAGVDTALERAPAIHAAGVAEGRAAMLREVVAWARLMAIESPVYLAAEWNRFADAIEVRFPSEETTT